MSLCVYVFFLRNKKKYFVKEMLQKYFTYVRFMLKKYQFGLYDKNDIDENFLLEFRGKQL